MADYYFIMHHFNRVKIKSYDGSEEPQEYSGQTEKVF